MTAPIAEAEVPVIRKPERNVAVYNLGHYEQMLLSLAIEAALGNVESQFALLEGNRSADLAGLHPMFAAHGTVAVTRTESE